MERSLRAFCLGVSGITNPPIDQTLVASLTKTKIFGAFCIAGLEGCMALMAEIELCKIAVQVSFAAMLVGAAHAASKSECTASIIFELTPSAPFPHPAFDLFRPALFAS